MAVDTAQIGRGQLVRTLLVQIQCLLLLLGNLLLQLINLDEAAVHNTLNLRVLHRPAARQDSSTDELAWIHVELGACLIGVAGSSSHARRLRVSVVTRLANVNAADQLGGFQGIASSNSSFESRLGVPAFEISFWTMTCLLRDCYLRRHDAPIVCKSRLEGTGHVHDS